MTVFSVEGVEYNSDLLSKDTQAAVSLLGEAQTKAVKVERKLAILQASIITLSSKVHEGLTDEALVKNPKGEKENAT